MPKKASRPTSRKLDFAEFVLDETTGMSLRYAQILLFAKTHYPGEFIPKAVLFRVANRRAKTPTKDSPDLKGMSAILARTKKLLTQDPYGELLMQEVGCYRLAVSYEERLVDVLPKAAQNYERQTERFARVVDLQDVSRVLNRPELEPFKEHFSKLRVLVHKVRSTTFQSALQIPKLPAHKDEEA